MIAKLSGPMLPPAAGGTPRRAVVLLHGYGADGRDLLGLAPYWRAPLPDAAFIAPNAPEPCPDIPGGYQWFPIDPGRVEFRLDRISAVAPTLAGFLDEFWAQTGILPGQTILAGFSQGAMMALHVGLSLDRPVLGIVAFSGALIVPPGLLERPGPRPPVCLVHGDEDAVVDPAFGREAADALGTHGFAVSAHVEPGGGHTISEAGLAFATRFISDIAVPN